jgi:hypothetical protein
MNAITNNAHRPFDVEPQFAAVALERLDPLRPLRDGLTALGLDQRVAIRALPTKAGPSTGSVSAGISWSLPGGSRAELTWTASVDPFADNRSLLSSSVQAGADDAKGAAGMVPAPELETPVRAQIQAVKDALAPWAAKQMYLNFAESQLDPATFWTEQAYQRLRRIKTAIDPDNVIRSNHAIPPALSLPREDAGALPPLTQRR